ncbi:hypothetical protein QBC40DRAFT_328879 [Triangularia verruculosa]|uniref:Uncharacterized protein n=1 Tax=Triangularia verruculosa TaxID=2587418 RepID=A0AAN7AUR9_9PEZI|nr:hypothetical protein QBC40DRAFT_328879 [Triangularia verruculosa]
MMMTKLASKTTQTARLGRGQFEPQVSSPLRPRVLEPDATIDEGAPAPRDRNNLTGSTSFTDEAENDIAIRVDGNAGDDAGGEEKLGGNKVDGNKVDNDEENNDEEDGTRAALGDITYLLTIPTNSKTFCLPQIVRPSSHKFAPKTVLKVAEQGSEPGPSAKTETATATTTTQRNAPLSRDLVVEIELPEQDENIPPAIMPTRRRSGARHSSLQVPSPAAIAESSLSHREIAEKIVKQQREDREACEKWNAESRKLVSMRGTCRGRRQFKKSDRIKKGLGFEIFVDETSESGAPSSDEAEEESVTEVVEDTSSSISDFELPSPVFEGSSLLDASTPEE